MNEYIIKLKAVTDWCFACEWTVTDFHRLFVLMHGVIHYRKLWADAKSPEAKSLAAWSRDIAITEIREFMRARCFPEEIRKAVIWLYEH